MVDRTRKFHFERMSHDSSELSKQMDDSRRQDSKPVQVYIRFLGSHAEHDKINAEEISHDD